MTNEVEEGDVITEFVLGDVKNYVYTTREGKVECKVRGFTLNVMEATWIKYYGKDFTWIVLELIGALEQRIRVVTKMEGVHRITESTPSPSQIRVRVKRPSQCVFFNSRKRSLFDSAI